MVKGIAASPACRPKERLEPRNSLEYTLSHLKADITSLNPDVYVLQAERCRTHGLITNRAVRQPEHKLS